MKKIDESEETFDKKKDKWQKKISQLESVLEKTKDSLHEEKARCRHKLASVLEKTKNSLHEEKARCRHKLTNEELRRNKLEEESRNYGQILLQGANSHLPH